MPNNLPPIWKFDFGDYSQLGDTFQKFLANINLFTLAVYNLINGGLTFANMQRKIKTFTLTAGTTTPLAFVNPLDIVPSGISVVQVNQAGNTNVALTSAVSAANWFFDGTNIHILNITGLTSGLNYSISLEVF